MQGLRISSVFTAAVFAFLFLFPVCCEGQGLALSGVGAVNRSFGGASTAYALDPSGALHWNPATLTDFKRAETNMGLELLWVDSSLESKVPGAEGSTDNEVGPSPIPAISAVKPGEGSDLTFGIGFFGVAGFRDDYPASTSNPILAPQNPAGGGGLGHILAEAEIFQIVPGFAYRLSDCLSIGFAPVLSIVRLQLTPLVLASPNSDGRYAEGASADYSYGGGFDLGVRYIPVENWHLGASLKSPQWIEDFRFDTSDANGLQRTENVDIDYPLIASAGGAYTGFERWVLETDFRYFDYSNTDGFDETGFDDNGAVKGLGWKSIFAAAFGVQYSPIDSLSFRLGYTYNENPISSSDAFFNAASPLITQHLLGVGASVEAVKDVILSVAYLHGFENSVSGPIQTPYGEVPDTEAKSTLSADALGVAVTMRY